jgi:hypothetical protein
MPFQVLWKVAPGIRLRSVGDDFPFNAVGSFPVKVCRRRA